MIYQIIYKISVLFPCYCGNYLSFIFKRWGGAANEVPLSVAVWPRAVGVRGGHDAGLVRLMAIGVHRPNLARAKLKNTWGFSLYSVQLTKRRLLCDAICWGTCLHSSWKWQMMSLHEEHGGGRDYLNRWICERLDCMSSNFYRLFTATHFCTPTHACPQTHTSTESGRNEFLCDFFCFCVCLWVCKTERSV